MFKNALILAALLLPVGFAHAHAFTVGELRIDHPWSQELPPNAPTVAAYFTLLNQGATADRLTGVDSPIAGRAELHEHVMQDNLMKMQQVPQVAVPAKGEVKFAPMAYHVMLLDLRDRSLLRDGQHFPLTLHFEKAGAVTVDVSVQKQPPAAADKMHMHAQ